MSATSKQKIDLLEDFPPHTKKSWEIAAKKFLKGKPLETLETKTYEEIDLQTIYPTEDINTTAFKSALPGEPRSRRGRSSYGSHQKPWRLLQEIIPSTPFDLNIQLKRNLNSGQNAILLRIAQESQFTQNVEPWITAFKDIQLENVPLFIKSYIPGKIIFNLLQQLFDHSHFDIKKFQGGIFFDPLAQSVFKGSSQFSPEEYYSEFSELIKWVGENAPAFGIFSNDATVYHNAGANAVQELAFVLAAAVESIRQIQNRDNWLEFSPFFKTVDFNFSIGSNFFMEIAKLRALRILWDNISKAFGGDEEHSEIKIHTETSAWNKTTLDEHTNILRTTTEAFSAILGGCDSLQIFPFNFLSNETDAFSERIARNIQLILKDEVHSGKVPDAAGGSWFVESLTKSLAEKAWRLFQEVEKKGGMIAALQQGFIQKSISKTRSLRMRDIETRRSKIIGVNIYPNLNEKISKAASKIHRAAEPFERLRARIEAHALKNSRPEVLLLNYGAVEAYKPRADFTRGFFEVAGFKISENMLDKKLEIVLNSKIAFINFCSSDLLYPEFVPALCQKLKSQNSELKIIVAGNPKNYIDTFKQAGVDDFIHSKSNVFEILNRLMQEIGIV